MNKSSSFKLHKTRKPLLVCLFAMLISVLAILSGGLLLFKKDNNSNADATAYPSYFCLRDDYYIQLTDQGYFGTCWSFANVKSIEECLAQKTGEHFEFSETYIALNAPYQDLVGNGGNVYYVYDAVRANGLVLDSDLPYDEIYYLNDNNNTNVISSLADKADTHTVTMSYPSASEYSLNTAVIKNYLMSNGNCTISIDDWDLVTNRNNNKNELTTGSVGGHALNVLGWDDSYVATNGTKGAYIILNSHGDFLEDGIVYLPYNTTIKRNVIAYSFQVSLPSDYIYLSSNANYTVNMKNKYVAASNYTAQSTTLKDKNIFDVNDDFKLDYQLPAKENLTYNLEIYRGDVLVNDKFTILKDDMHCYVYKKDSLPSGCYKLVFNYSYPQRGVMTKRRIVKQLFLLDELELSLVDKRNETVIRDNVVIDSLTMTDNNIYITQFQPQTQYPSFISPSKYLDMAIYFSPYSNYTSYSLKKGGTTLQSGELAKYTKYDYKISLKVDTNVFNEGTTILTLQLNNANHSKTYYIHVNTDSNAVYNGESGANTKYTTYLNINLGGGHLSENFQSKVLLSDSLFRNYYLENPVKENYRFTSYQYLNASNQWVDLPYDDLREQYYITQAQVRHYNKGNFLTQSVSNYNYKNSVLVKANYVAEQSPISFVCDNNTSDTFEVDDNIIVSLTNSKATDIVWKLDNQEYSNSSSFSINTLRSGNHNISVTFKVDNKEYNYSRILYIKNFVYMVKYDQKVFKYNKSVQKPEVTIEGLVLGKDYDIECPDSVNAGNYQLKIIPIANDIYLNETSISYTIEALPLYIEVDSQIIDQFDSIREFNYTVTGWIEDEPLQISFNTASVDVNTINYDGYEVKFNLLNLPANNYIQQDCEYPCVFVMPIDFKIDNIQLTTQTISGEALQEIQYGQKFTICFNYPRKMFKEVTYTLNGKTFNNTVYHYTDKLPLGKYKLSARAKLNNEAGDILEREIEIEIVTAKITIVAQSKEGLRGKQPSNLEYLIEKHEDVDVSELIINLEVVDLDVNTLGTYVIMPVVSGNKVDNFEIQFVTGEYTVVKPKSLNLTSSILLGVLIGAVGVIAIANVIYVIRRKKKKSK